MACYVWQQSGRCERVVVGHETNMPPEDAMLMGKLVHLAIPVRWSLVEQNRRGPVEMACTYDIHPHGARLLGSRKVKVGDLVMVERGRNKALCQVVCTGPRDSQLRGQFSVQCVEDGKTPWDEELRQMEEQYQPIMPKGVESLSNMRRRADDNRRRRPRYFVEGTADLIDGLQRVEAEVQQLSEIGARIAAKNMLRPGTDFRLLLNVFDVSVAGSAPYFSTSFSSDSFPVAPSWSSTIRFDALPVFTPMLADGDAVHHFVSCAVAPVALFCHPRMVGCFATCSHVESLQVHSPFTAEY